MLKRAATALAYLGWVGRNFIDRLIHKGIRSAAIFLKIRWLNFRIGKLNNRSTSDPGLVRVECPCCGWRGYDFFAYDAVIFWIPSVHCPGCGSHERHRMLHTYIHRHDPDLPQSTGRLLHFAPEDDVRRIFAGNDKLKYFSTDFLLKEIRARCVPGTAVLTDIQQLGIATDSFDIIFCAHVLEHVRQDRQAIGELERVLKPGGVAYIMVPFDMALAESREWDEPNPDISDHIWAYSIHDFKDRLAVFDVLEITPASYLTPEEQERFGIPPKEIIYRCVKRGRPSPA